MRRLRKQRADAAARSRSADNVRLLAGSSGSEFAAGLGDYRIDAGRTDSDRRLSARHFAAVTIAASTFSSRRGLDRSRSGRRVSTKPQAEQERASPATSFGGDSAETLTPARERVRVSGAPPRKTRAAHRPICPFRKPRTQATSIVRLFGPDIRIPRHRANFRAQIGDHTFVVIISCPLDATPGRAQESAQQCGDHPGRRTVVRTETRGTSSSCSQPRITIRTYRTRRARRTMSSGPPHEERVRSESPMDTPPRVVARTAGS